MRYFLDTEFIESGAGKPIQLISIGIISEDEALKMAATWAEWQHEALDDFHEYGQMFHATPGGNVFMFVLQDALRHRGLTLERLRAARALRK